MHQVGLNIFYSRDGINRMKNSILRCKFKLTRLAKKATVSQTNSSRAKKKRLLFEFDAVINKITLAQVLINFVETILFEAELHF